MQWESECRYISRFGRIRFFFILTGLFKFWNPAPPTAGAAPPKKKAPRSECAIDTDRELPVFAASNMIFPIV